MTVCINGHKLSPHFIEQLSRVPQIERDTLGADLDTVATLLKPFRGRNMMAAHYKKAVWIYNQGVFATIYSDHKVTNRRAQQMGWEK